MNIIRYPDRRSPFPTEIFIAMTIGAVKKAINMANHYSGQLVGIIQILFEWKQKHFDIKWILDAMYGSNILHKKLTKQVISRLWQTIQA